MKKAEKQAHELEEEIKKEGEILEDVTKRTEAVESDIHNFIRRKNNELLFKKLEKISK